MSNKKYTICIDFDGVVHSYVSGWLGEGLVTDPPVADAFNFLNKLLDAGYIVAIYSSRSKTKVGIDAMVEWFLEWEYTRIDELSFPTQKPAAYLTIDDRCICFTGIWPSVAEIQNFKSWVKKNE